MAIERINLAVFGPRGRRAFFWQGLLIVLPVVVLAAMGFFSLRQDKILAHHEATERAQALADQLAQTVWAELTEANNFDLPSFKIDQAGQLLFPPPYAAVPPPHPFQS